MTTVYRIQASDGRGPFRPGFAKYWDDDGYRPMPIQDAFGMAWLRQCRKGYSYGCACKTVEGLAKWFRPSERRALEKFGYRPVSIVADHILRENSDQVLFGSKHPFAEAAIDLSWSILDDGEFI
jgi:hypothetical protein